MSVPNTDRPLTLWEYFDRVFCPFKNLELPRKPIHKHICDVLEAAFLGVCDKKYIIINVPPRTGKTMICEAFVSWGLTYFPEAQWIYSGYSADLATESVRRIRDTLSYDWHLALFGPRIGNIGQADRFSTVANGNVFGVGNEGTLTGRGAGLKRQGGGGAIILDDPAKPNAAMSTVEREKLCAWFEGTLMSRCNSPKTPVVLCAQRLAPDDLCAFVMENYPGKYLVIRVPALDPVTDESNFPETRDTESLRDMRRVDPFAFAAQYQQDPVVMGGNLIKTDWFPRFDMAEAATLQFSQKIIAADTAMKTKTSNDYSVLGVFGVVGRSAYLIDVVRGRWQSPELVAAFKHLYVKHSESSPVRSVFIEDASSGTAIIQDLKRFGLPVQSVVRMKDKITRVMDVLPVWMTGRLFLPKDGQTPWMEPLLHELQNFRQDGRAKHDDQVDMLELGTSKTLTRPVSIFDVL